MQLFESFVEVNEQTIAGWRTDTVCIKGTFVNHPGSTTVTKEGIPSLLPSCSDCQNNDCESSNLNDGRTNQQQEEREEEKYQRTRLNLVLIFLPGNPGCIEWYIPMLKDILEQVVLMTSRETKNSISMEVWGCSYAGHGVGDHKTNPISSSNTTEEKNNHTDTEANFADAHTLEGQIRHKIEWLDWMMAKKVGNQNKNINDNDNLKFIWLSHSIGSYLVQEILLRRPLWLKEQTLGVIHLMPFIRFDPSLFLRQSLPLNVVAQTTYTPKAPFNRLLQTASVALSKLPSNKLDELLEHNAGIQCPKMRQFTSELITQPKMAENFLTLGCHEIRLLKAKTFDELMLNIIGQCCSLYILYGGVGPDQWAPITHYDQLLSLQRRGKIPQSIQCCYQKELKHDFIVNTEYMTPIVTQYCVNTIQAILSMAFVEKSNNNNKCEIKQLPVSLRKLKSKL